MDEKFLEEDSSSEEKQNESEKEDFSIETKSRNELKNEEKRKKNEGYSRQVYIGNINFEMKEKDIRKFFAECGKIKKVYFPLDYSNKTKGETKPRPKGFAIITFSTEDEAAEAVDLDGAEVMKRKLQIRHRTKGHLTKKPKNCRTVFVSNLNFKANAEEIKNHFSNCGEIVDVRIPKSKKGFSYGNAYVEFTETEHVDKAIGLNETKLSGREIKVNWALPDSVNKMQKKITESLTLLVSSLPRNAGVEQIQSFIEQSGVTREKVNIRLQKKPDGSSKGQCYLDFEEMNDAFTILKKNDTVFNGRRLNISVSLPKENSKRKREGEAGSRKKMKMSWMDKKLPRSAKPSRTCILHGVPRTFRYEQVQEIISEYKPKSFSRYKASIAVTFDSRKEMLECLQGSNSKITNNGKSFKLNAAVSKPPDHFTIQLHGCPKTMTNEEITNALRETHSGVNFCFRDKKVVFCDVENNELKIKLLEEGQLKLDEKKILVRK